MANVRFSSKVSDSMLVSVPTISVSTRKEERGRGRSFDRGSNLFPGSGFVSDRRNPYFIAKVLDTGHMLFRSEAKPPFCYFGFMGKGLKAFPFAFSVPFSSEVSASTLLSVPTLSFSTRKEGRGRGRGVSIGGSNPNYFQGSGFVSERGNPYFIAEVLDTGHMLFRSEAKPPLCYFGFIKKRL